MSLSSLPPPAEFVLQPEGVVTKDSKERKIADEEPHDEAPPSWSAVLLKLCDELEPWAKWKVYDTVFAVALFIVLRRFKLLVPTAKLLQWL